MLKALKKYKAPYLFILPFFILFFVFQLVPTIWTFYISFTDWKGIGDPEFSGLGNYKKMMVDNMFWESLGNTVVYWLTGLVFILFCALLIACLLNSRFLKSNSARAFFKTATFLPNICAAIAMGLIFRMLFENKENLLSLYNAMNHKNYTDADALQVVTLENSIYMGMKNDLAFILDMNLYLYEHQSTYNPNMPLRDLFYISNEYQKLVVQKSLYSSVLQKIPAPKFVVFYNGTKEIEDVSEFRLSSAYECQTDDPDLELRVTVLNVNEGHNQELMEHCQTLKEYAQYVAKVRKYTSLGELSLEEAVECAVEECIKEGILAEFLIQNRAEVISMSIFEYNKDEEEKKLRKAEFEAGREAGIEEGRMAGLEEGREEGRIELLKQLIQRKLSKGKSIDKIAEELEE